MRFCGICSRTITAGAAKIQSVTAARFHHARGERREMTNILLVVIFLLLVDIYQQLKKMNEGTGNIGADRKIDKNK